MAKRIVICLDGTGDFAAKSPTHVFRLFCSLQPSKEQMLYSNGGVGTLRDASTLSKLGKTVRQDLDLAAGFGLRDLFVEVCSFLSRVYEEEDEIFIFGFNRGAYAARALVGAIHYVGIFRPEHQDVIPYLWQTFSSIGSSDSATTEDFDMLERMRTAFGRPATVKFLGLWDTVSSFGLIKLRALPQTHKLDAAITIRHAVSLDERRNMFPENLVDPRHKGLVEVWFPGVHRDVGGGGASGTLGLSMFAYEWLASEAVKFGLPESCLAASHPASDAKAKDNYSLGLVVVYGAMGLVPMKWWSQNARRFRWRWFNLWHVRQLPPDALVHHSIRDRKDKLRNYQPRQLHSWAGKWLE